MVSLRAEVVSSCYYYAADTVLVEVVIHRAMAA